MSTRRTLVFPFAEDQFWVELVAEGRRKIPSWQRFLICYRIRLNCSKALKMHGLTCEANHARWPRKFLHIALDFGQKRTSIVCITSDPIQDRMGR
jgi:hypothetical protein